MTPRHLRIVFVFEFLIALVAIFTTWSEIGGQAALDLMHWGWKLGFSTSLAGTIVAFTAAISAQDSWWTLRSARWLTVILLILAAAAVVTYFYALQAETGDSDDTSTASLVVCPRSHAHRT